MKRRIPCVAFVDFGEVTGSRPLTWECVNPPAVFPRQPKAVHKWNLEKTTWPKTLHKDTSIPSSQLTTDGYVEAVQYRVHIGGKITVSVAF